MISEESVIMDLNAIRLQAPLVQNITNYVVMNITANALLAIGASPVMAHAEEEVEDMLNIASSLVINIGTLSNSWVTAMIKAGKAAKDRGIPVVLDPVGAGATAYRTKTSLQIIKECRPGVIRGNASEIMALVNDQGNTKGVDSMTSPETALQAAEILAKDTGAVVVISGPVDYILDGHTVIQVRNGASMMGRVTGLGCMATALAGAFMAVNRDFFLASAHAMTVMGIAGELAAKRSDGPGTMQVYILDSLYKLTGEEISKYFNAK